ncbi:MAG: hypothetical protein O2816_12520, partial [Planctomycetota bacterium]|nr:hypothetical protein [Planctomycetota bacterium]
MSRLTRSLACLTLTAPALTQGLAHVRFPEGALSGPVNGRVLLLFSADPDIEPRFGVRGGLGTCQVFGIDVEDWQAGAPVEIGAGVFGYPVEDYADLPPGKYTVQAVFHRYETFTPAHGHTLLLPMDRGEGQHWNRAPGNLYSTPQPIDFNPRLRSI